MKLHTFDTQADASRTLADAISADLQAAIAARGRAVLAVSGGRSPIPLLQMLAQAAIDWQHVTVTLVDERVVAPEHADSNGGLVRTHLLQGAAAAAAFLPLVQDGRAPESECATARTLWHTPDVAVLGMGEDGHTASLFPAAANLAAGLDPANRDALIVVQPPAAAHSRISMTLAELLRCPRLYLAIAGESKRRVLAEAERAVSDSLPISHLLPAERADLNVYWAP